MITKIILFHINWLCPSIWGSVISAGANLLGGILGNKSSEDINAKNRSMQKEFATHGIRWKVEDAKAAGVHPLYAVGAPTIAATPSYVGNNALASGISAAGQDLGRAVDAAGSPPEREIKNATLEHLKAQTEKETAVAAYYQSQAARTQQAREASKAVPVPATAYPMGARPANQNLKVIDMQHYFDTSRGKPEEVISQRSTDPSVSAATHSTWREYRVKPGVIGVLPFSEEGVSEALQDANWERVYAIYKINREKYGEKAAGQFVRTLFPAFGSMYSRFHEGKSWSKKYLGPGGRERLNRDYNLNF